MRSLLLILIILASISVLLGCLFKIQHWPIANVFLGAGIATELICAILLVMNSLKERKKG
ncbi:MAG: hypothetical protein ABI378_14255 [Chitinophagaceae bacterium]